MSLDMQCDAFMAHTNLGAYLKEKNTHKSRITFCDIAAAGTIGSVSVCQKVSFWLDQKYKNDTSGYYQDTKVEFLKIKAHRIMSLHAL